MKRALILVLILLPTVLCVCFGLSGCAKENDEAQSPEEALAVTFIDVGKGDCILAEFGEKRLMIDAGYEETADKVLGLLEQNGIDSLDALIITHYDKDHVGGAARIAESVDISQIYLPDYAGKGKEYNSLLKTIEDKQLSMVQVSEDTHFSIGDAVFTILASDVEYNDPKDGEGNDNDVSLVVTALYGADSWLFAGDIEKEGISSFLGKSKGSFGVMKMPHHGGKSGNTDELIEAVKPKIAVITDSADDPASDKTLELLEGAEVYRTSECGSIRITGTGNGTPTAETHYGE